MRRLCGCVAVGWGCMQAEWMCGMWGCDSLTVNRVAVWLVGCVAVCLYPAWHPFRAMKLDTKWGGENSQNINQTTTLVQSMNVSIYTNHAVKRSRGSQRGAQVYRDGVP